MSGIKPNLNKSPELGLYKENEKVTMIRNGNRNKKTFTKNFFISQLSEFLFIYSPPDILDKKDLRLDLLSPSSLNFTGSVYLTFTACPL